VERLKPINRRSMIRGAVEQFTSGNNSIAVVMLLMKEGIIERGENGDQRLSRDKLKQYGCPRVVRSYQSKKGE
jgi:hypothetical protein